MKVVKQLIKSGGVLLTIFN